MKKRIVSLFVVLSLLIMTLNVSVFASSNTNTALNLLKELSILDDATLENSLDEEMTRIDFITLLLKSTGVDEATAASSGTQYFYDVEPDARNAGYVEYAYKAGITNGIGDGLFGAKSIINVGQAITMCIRALNYEIVLEDPATQLDYMYLAGEMGLTKDIAAGYNTPLTFGDAYCILYRAMTTNFMRIYVVANGAVAFQNEVDSNYLTSVFDIKVVDGIVNNTPFAALDKKEYTKKGYVQIGDNMYNVGLTDAEDLFGYRVKAYYRDGEDEDTLVWIDKSKTTSIKFAANEVNRYKPLLLTYDNGTSKEGECKISPEAVTIVNGSVKYITNSYTFPDVGFVELIDNNDDEVYDVVKITDYDITVAGSLDANNLRIIDDKNSANIIKLGDVKYYTIKDIEGNEIPFESIIKGSILHVEKNPDGKFINLVMLNDSVSFTVSEISSDITRGYKFALVGQETGETYYVSTAYDDIATNPNITTSNTYTFMLNIHGDIVSASISETKMVYGLLKNYAAATGLGNAEFRIYTADGLFTTLTPAKKVRFFDGTELRSLRSHELVTTLDTIIANSSTLEMPFIIRYSLNSAGEMNALELPGSIVNGYGFKQNAKAGRSYAARYKTSTNTIGGYIVVHPEAVIFGIPQDTDDETKYTIRDRSDLKNDVFYYNSIGYSADENGYMSEAITIPDDTGNRTYSFIVFEKMGKLYDPETMDEYDTIIGFVEGKRQTFKIDPNVNLQFLNDASSSNNVHTPKAGDYIAIFTSADGLVVKARMVFDTATEKAYKVYKNKDIDSTDSDKIMNDHASGLSIGFRADAGLITRVIDGYMQMNNNGAYSFNEYFKLSSTAFYYIIDKDQTDPSKRLTIGSISDVVADGATGIFTDSRGGIPTVAIIVKGWDFVQGGTPNLGQDGGGTEED